MSAGTTQRSQVQSGKAHNGDGRAFRGLVLVFLLSFLSLFGILLTITAMGGLGDWTRWQFIGLFGLVEAGSGLANIIVPNIWRLPVAELQTKHSTEVKLAASAMLIPHWGGATRMAAGVVLVTAAAAHEGAGAGTVGVVVLGLLFAWILVTASALVARAGVARPETDVVQFVVRWGGKETEVPPISIGASVLQFLLGIITIPMVKLMPPDSLYRPELGVSPLVLAAAVIIALAFTGATVAVWAGRIDWHAPREQQREAEKFA